MAVVDGESVTHDLESQACVLMNTRGAASAHRRQSTLSLTFIVLAHEVLWPDPRCAPTIAAL